MKRILIVEDEITISRLIAVSLRRAGYDCTVANDGSTAADLIAEHDFDLALLDIMLPGLDGYELLGYLRPLGVPVIFITAKGATKDRVRGLQLGADDYIVKPFSNMELLMRVKAILRRSSGVKAPVVTEKIPFADLILDTESRSVSRQGELIPLTYTEFRILELFVTHKKKIYSLENIYQSIWGEDAVGDSAIMVHIKNIRKKLGDDSRNPKYIKTAWGRGYYVDQ